VHASIFPLEINLDQAEVKIHRQSFRPSSILFAVPTMRKLPLTLFCLAIAGCAHQSEPPAPPPPAPPSVPVLAEPPLPPVLPPASPPPAPAPPTDAKSAEEPASLLEGTDLRQAISSWISEHEDADFELVTRMANRMMHRYGYPISVDASPLLKPGQDSLRLKAGNRTFLLRAGHELALGADACGERYLRLPVRLLGGNDAALVSGGRTYPFSLAPFRREEFRAFRGKRLIATFSAPEPTEPIGISGNGRALFLRFPLDEQLAINWWQRVARHQPSVLDEDPYLVLRVSKKRLYFDENIEHLPTQEIEVDEDTDPGNYHWRFLPQGFRLEFSTSCNH
jgi:hypothetical protein